VKCVPLALLGYPLVIPGAGTAPRQDAEGLFEAHGVALPPGCTETQPVSLGRALALMSDAVWITPRRAVQLDIDSGSLCRLNVRLSARAESAGGEPACLPGAHPVARDARLAGCSKRKPRGFPFPVEALEWRQAGTSSLAPSA
jgi:DNA-binding transcriptional LysR family regulator